MNLQIFADGDGAGADDGQGGGAGSAGDGTDGTRATTEPKSFDDILKDGSYQAEFDRRVQKALETQKNKLEVLMDAKASEAEKLSKMNKEEKAQYYTRKEKRNWQTKRRL